MEWDFKKIKKNRNNQRIPIVRFGEVDRKYKSISDAARHNNVDPKTIRHYIATQRKLNGYLFDYQ